MKAIGLIANKDKDNVLNLLQFVINWLKQRGVKIMMDQETSSILDDSSSFFTSEEMANHCDCILVLGGDGTMLNTARIAAPWNIPLLGINLGRLGFLSEIDIPNVEEGLEKLLHGEYQIEKRMMLQAQVLRQGKLLDVSIALNDAVITKGAFSRLIRLQTNIDGEKVAVYPVDGIIVASPTGSTAYSLSAGGPVVIPEMDLMILTPICPHSLWARPLIIASNSQLKVKLLSDNAEVMLTMDGQHAFRLEQNDEIMVTKAPYKANFIKLSGRSFYSVLHSKLNEGDLRHDETSC